MRTTPEGAGDHWYRRGLVSAAVLGGTLLGGLTAGPAGLAGGLLLGVAIGLALGQRAGGRIRRRAALLAAAPGAGWRERLARLSAHYARLPSELRDRFDNDARIFLAEQRITGVGVDVSDELRLLVSISAVTLSVGWPGFEWDSLAEVLLYPEDFDRDYGFARADRAGETHPWGTILLSVPSLLDSFDDHGDGFNVGYHEFAHLLDVEQTEFDGSPAGLGSAGLASFVEIRAREMERLARGRSVLDPYGADDEVEFFPVAVEAFFELPVALRERHRELYALLEAYFRQDPAEWQGDPPAARRTPGRRSRRRDGGRAGARRRRPRAM